MTGGAGYIGAHVVRSLQQQGMTPVVLDDLSSGLAKFVPDGVAFVQADINDTVAVTAALTDHGCVGVIHVAGFKYAGVSVQRPLHTYTQNVTGTASVLAAMEAAGVKHIVFSSSAAVFGTPDTELVTEESATRPESPYGESKLIGEWLIADVARAREGFTGVCLRYFNVVGSATDEVYDASPHNLFRWSSRPCWPDGRRGSMAWTTRPRTGPVCATTSMSATWPTPMWPRRRRCWPGRR